MTADFRSRAVAWWPVHEFVTAVTETLGCEWPMAGTPAWCELADDDPRKLAAVIEAGSHHVLRVEVAQVAQAEASKAVAAAADWPEVAREINARRNFRETHPWARRVTA